LAERYRLETELPPDMAIQGEVCGPGIQGNRLGLAQVELFVFNVYDLRLGDYHTLRQMLAVCERYGLRTVPIEEIIVEPHARNYPHTLEHWLDRAKGPYTNSRTHKEGVVVRPLIEQRSTTLQGRLSFKVINNDFLLKED
jgi:ATP-dependent RNA circularization protein (DNA/RNA ligase family)